MLSKSFFTCQGKVAIEMKEGVKWEVFSIKDYSGDVSVKHYYC